MKKTFSIFIALLIVIGTLFGSTWVTQKAYAQAPPHTMWGYVKSPDGATAGQGLTVQLYNTNKSRSYSSITDSNGIWLIDLENFEDGNILKINASYMNLADNSSPCEIVEVVAKSPGTQQAKDLLLKKPHKEPASISTTLTPEQEKPGFSVLKPTHAILIFLGLTGVAYLIRWIKKDNL